RPQRGGRNTVGARAAPPGQAGAHQARRGGARRAGQGRGGFRSRVRSRRIPLPRPRTCLRRGNSRDRHVRLAPRRTPPATLSLLPMSTPEDRSVSSAGLDLQERVVEIKPVAKVAKGGRRVSFAAL